MLSLSSLSAQTFNSAIEEDVAASLPHTGNSIVRNWNNNFVFSYHTDGTHSYFVCTKVGDFLSPYYATGPNIDEYYQAIPPSYNIWIKDIRIVDDYAFFCGWESNTTTSQGIIGAIYLPAFISGLFSYDYHQIPQTLELSRMVAYNYGGRYKVVAVGTDTSSQTSNNCAVEIDDSQSTAPLSYIYRDFYISSPNIEYINDIVCTDKEVAFVGVVISPTNGHYLSYRASADKSAVLSDLSLDYIYVMLQPFESSGIHPRAVHLRDNLVAVSYLHDDGMGSLSSRMRVIDVASNQNVNSQEMSIDQKEEPIETVYSPASRKMVLLHPMLNLPGGTSQFSFWRPFATSSYNVDITYYTEPFYSLDIFHNTNLVSTGGNLWYLQDLLSFSNRACPSLTKWRALIINPLTIKQYTSASPATPDPTSFQSLPGASTPGILKLDCNTSN